MTENNNNSGANSVFGMTSWTIETGNFKKTNNKDLYLRLNDGSNVVRVLTKPFEYLVHQWKINKDDPGFGHRVMSSKFHGSDILEEKYGSKPKRRWLIGVICRKTQSYKLLDISKSVFDGIKSLVTDEEWGSPEGYDIDIKVNKQAPAVSYYTIIPRGKKPLSPADLEIKQNIDLDDIKKRCTPPTPDELITRINAILAKANKPPIDINSNVSTTQTVESNNSDEDDQFEFPPVT